MEEKREENVCWISEEDNVMSFHFVEGYIRKEFTRREDFLIYIAEMAKYYRVQ
ncbi:MAG: hypothetical protein Q4B31_05260 [Clostridia bacterium]|nr:hypothetical protein [Clostridia bacterium]